MSGAVSASPKNESSLVLDIKSRFVDHNDVNQLLLHAVGIGASDIFIQQKRHVHAMLQGDLIVMTKRHLDDSEVKVILNVLANRENATTDISSGRAVNASYKITQPVTDEADKTGNGRARRKGVEHFFRVNAVPIYPKGCEITLRLITQKPPDLESIGLDETQVRKLISPHGSFLVSGATGSGKTTTFAAIIRYILENNTPIKGHILTHEEPIEYRYDKIQSSHSIIVQSQIPDHFPTFHAANREAMRRRPAMVLVGELRDLETIQSAVEIARTGHAIYATVHATDVASIPQRLVSRYPQEAQREAIFDIIDTAHALMTQRLVKGVDNRQLALRECLILTREIRNHLLNLGDQGRITQALRTLVLEHGSSFADDARRLLDQGRISQSVADEFLRPQ